MQTIHVDLSHCKLRWWIIVLNKGSIANKTWWSLVVILSQRYQTSHSLVLQMNYTWSLAVKSSAAISTKLQPVSSSFSQPSPWISILLGEQTRSKLWMLQTFCRIKPSIIRWHAVKHPQRKLRSNMILLCSIEDQLEPSSAPMAPMKGNWYFPNMLPSFILSTKTWLQDKTVWVPMRTCEVLLHKSWQPMDRR